MGIAIALVNYKCETLNSVEDPTNILHRLLPRADENSESLLSKIDWYGDTFFNYLQMKKFLQEWDEVARHVQAPEERMLLGQVRDLAARCQEQRELLRFIGD